MNDDAAVELRDDEPNGEEEGEGFSLKREILEWVFAIAVAYGLLLIFTHTIAAPYIVPTGSMLDTIQLKDRVLCEFVTFKMRDPQYNDVVLFEDPADPETTLVKRVIATEGQVVDLRDGIVYVDDKPLDEVAYTQGKASDPIHRHASNLTEDVSYPFTVPEGHIWVMGDNRTYSLDSRYFGSVAVDDIVGRGAAVVWPPNDFKFL